VKVCRWKKCRKRFEPRANAQAYCSTRCLMDADNERDKLWWKAHPEKAKKMNRRRHLRRRRDPKKWKAYLKYHRDYNAVRLELDKDFRKRRRLWEKKGRLKRQLIQMGVDPATLESLTSKG